MSPFELHLPGQLAICGEVYKCLNVCTRKDSGSPEKGSCLSLGDVDRHHGPGTQEMAAAGGN